MAVWRRQDERKDVQGSEDSQRQSDTGESEKHPQGVGDDICRVAASFKKNISIGLDL